MSTNAIDLARQFVADAQARGVGALTPLAVARQLKVTEDQAVALLNCLVETEGTVKIYGYLSCPDCVEQILLKSTTLQEIIREAEQRAGSRCPFCGGMLPSTADVKVKLSFFCAAAKFLSSDLAAPKIGTPNSAESVVANLSQLREMASITCQYLVVASDCATVLIGENVSHGSASSASSSESRQQNTSVTHSSTVEHRTLNSRMIGSNPWVSGSFYLTVAVVILLLLLVAGRMLSAWVLPPVIIAAVLIICIVGGFQLRNDSKLSERSFLKLMEMTFRGLPLIRSFRKAGDPQ